MKKNLSLLCTVLIVVISTGCNGGDNQSNRSGDLYTSDPDPRHVRVIWTENPAEHAIVSWTTMAPATENIIYYDTESRSGDLNAYRFSTESERYGKITMAPMDETEGVPPGWYHHGQLHDLEPSTRYYLVVESDGEATEEYYFITAPTGDEPIKLLSGGDSRMGGDKPRYAGRTPHVDRQAMNRVMSQLLEENPDILALAHGADWGTTADWRHLYWWFEDNELVKTSDNRLLPFIVARGNHDEEIGFQESFWLAEITDQISFGYYFTTRIGSTVLFTLNSEISIAGDQREWLEEELEELMSGESAPKWLMAQYHRPAYPVAKEFTRHEFTRVRENWTPIFDQYQFDLGLESDGHLLKRTMPIRNFEPHKDGVVYIGEGGLGVPQRIPVDGLWFVQEPGFAASAHHVWLLDVTPESIGVKAIGENMEVIDEYTVRPKNRNLDL
jgi:acid phosphatase type 7